MQIVKCENNSILKIYEQETEIKKLTIFIKKF